MKKVFHLFSFVVLFMILCITNVNASECTTKEFRELKTLAKKVQIVYEFDEKYKIFSLGVYNLNKNLKIYSGMNSYDSDAESFDTGFQGSIYNYTLYATDKTNCVDEEIYSMKIKLPVYNRFYEYNECQNYPYLNICKKWYDTSRLQDTDLKREISKEKEKKQTNDFFEQVKVFIRKYYKQLLICIFGIILFGFSIIAFNKRKNKKIDI